MGTQTTQRQILNRILLNQTVKARFDDTLWAVSVAISAMAISNTDFGLWQTPNSVVRPKRKADIPPGGFGKKQKRTRIPTPPGAIVIGDSTSASSATVLFVGDTNSPQVKNEKHTNAANANAANANAASANAHRHPHVAN